MLKTLTTLLLTLLVLAVLGGAAVYLGVVNVGADKPHGAVLGGLLAFARDRSVEVRAARIEVPDLSDPELIRSGAGNYDAMCTSCHLAPGLEGTELSQNLNPAPPNLTDANRKHEPAEDFWVIKHGIQATGMPAWGRSMSDPYVWGLVALLEQLPALTAREYRALVATSGGHAHDGGAMQGIAAGAIKAEASPRQHPAGAEQLGAPSAAAADPHGQQHEHSHDGDAHH
ncbi:cytochrome c [Pseudomonas sp.]|uniref:c-type cytochrome n=1 Tax=Pseudomonas sp. TaxID=306 RepID=UPI0028A83C58|nr:cytochrome c [Pseudomonas sp.]